MESGTPHAFDASMRLSSRVGLAIFLGISGGGCAAGSGQPVVFVSWSTGPSAPGDTRIRFVAERRSDLERWSDGDGRWELVCSAPCEETVSEPGALRIVTASTASQPFGLPPNARDWMTLKLDAGGQVFLVDSRELRARRSSDDAKKGLALWLLSVRR